MESFSPLSSNQDAKLISINNLSIATYLSGAGLLLQNNSCSHLPPFATAGFRTEQAGRRILGLHSLSYPWLVLYHY